MASAEKKHQNWQVNQQPNTNRWALKYHSKQDRDDGNCKWIGIAGEINDLVEPGWHCRQEQK